MEEFLIFLIIEFNFLTKNHSDPEYTLDNHRQ